MLKSLFPRPFREAFFFLSKLFRSEQASKMNEQKLYYVLTFRFTNFIEQIWVFGGFIPKNLLPGE